MTTTVTCRRCDAAQPSEQNYCTRCGYPLRSIEPASAPAEAAVDARFVACPACGATNAASRRHCGRCGLDLAGDAAGLEAMPPTVEAPPHPPAAEEADEPDAGSPVVFILAVTVAAAAIIGVILTIVSAAGVGPFARPPAEPLEPVLAISSVRASSGQQAEDGAGESPVEHLVDDDPATAWREAASGDGVGEWIELQLEGNPRIARLLIWNGDQREGRFATSSRVRSLRIDVGDRTFTADLLDVDGPQAIDLPEVVQASSLRLTIVDVIPGEGDVALSGVEVRGPPGDPGGGDD